MAGTKKECHPYNWCIFIFQYYIIKFNYEFLFSFKGQVGWGYYSYAGRRRNTPHDLDQSTELHTVPIPVSYCFSVTTCDFCSKCHYLLPLNSNFTFYCLGLHLPRLCLVPFYQGTIPYIWVTWLLANCDLALPWMDNSIPIFRNQTLSCCFPCSKILFFFFFVFLPIIGKFWDTDIIKQGNIFFILLDSGDCTYRVMSDVKIE